MIRVWLARLALMGAGASVMWWEGQHQPAPGVLFVVAMALMLSAAFVRRGKTYPCKRCGAPVDEADGGDLCSPCWWDRALEQSQ